MEHDQLYPNIFHQPSYNLQMYEEYIWTTTRFPLVYDNNPIYDFFIFYTPGKQDNLTVNIHFQLGHLTVIHTEEVDLLEFKRMVPCLPDTISNQSKGLSFSPHCFNQVDIHQ